jgi:hypothetical protein
MRKKILIGCTLLFLCSVSVSSQGLMNGYKFMYLPVVGFYDTVKDKQAEISAKAVLAFEEIGFRVYHDVDYLPPEILENKCQTLLCHFTYSSENQMDEEGNNLSLSIVYLDIQDCRDSILKEVKCTGQWPGTSWGELYLEAIRKAAKEIKFEYKYDPSKKNSLLKPWFPTLEMTAETEETLRTYFGSHPLDSIEGIYETAFDRQGTTYYRLGVRKYGQDYKAIILKSGYMSWKPGEVKAYLKGDSVPTIRYPTRWFTREKLPMDTYCEYENGMLALAIRAEGYKRTDVFRKIFPVKQF